MSERINSQSVQDISQGDDPLTYWTRVFVRFLQIAHATWDKSFLKWSPDDTLTDIIIQDQGTIAKEVVEKRPAIIVSRGPVAFTNVALNQFAGPAYAADGTYIPNSDSRIGSVRHTDLLSSTMTYNCLSKEGLEAQRIAWFCSYATRALKKVLLNAGLHRVGEEIQVGAETAPGAIVGPDSNEIILVPVYVPFYFQQTYTIAPKDKILLNEVITTISSELNYPSSGSEPIVEPGVGGNTVRYESVLTLSQASKAGPYKSPKPRRI